jgi:hypothetical protein
MADGMQHQVDAGECLEGVVVGGVSGRRQLEVDAKDVVAGV